MQYTNTQAHKYASEHAATETEIKRIYEAVLFGISKRDTKRKAIGDPLENVAYNYAAQFTELSIEERFKLHQAVFFGANLSLPIPVETDFEDQSIMPFGKHKGKRMINIPAFYLLWLYNEGCGHNGVRKYIIDNLAALQKEAGQKQKR
jgi:uncharacterized protein (DUF3820 family)